jgi:cell division protein FtsW
MQISRADGSLLARWWFTVDRALLGSVLVLIGAGVVLSLAASPAVAVKKGLAPFHFFERHLAYAAIGAGVLIAVSMLTPRSVRRLSLLLFASALAAMAGVLLVGDEINGARRWLRLAGFSLQPSEFAKPAFVVLAAWAFAEAGRRREMPARSIALALYLALATLLVLQPDVGQTLLVSAVWGALFFVSGQSLLAAIGLAGAGGTGIAAAYPSYPHVRQRIDRFLAPVSGDNSQTERAMQSFGEGGFLGRGPGEGTIKSVLPDAHTDFIFAVVAEEFGIVACLALLALFGFVVLRALAHAAREPDPFLRLAITGLAAIFGLQALINMSVNVGLAPAKGMTLPFISAGGSSTVAIAITAGLLLALTRQRADAARLKMPRFTGTPRQLANVGPRRT